MICPCCKYDDFDDRLAMMPPKPFIEITHLERGPLVASRGWEGQAVWQGTPVKAWMCPKCGVVFGEVS